MLYIINKSIFPFTYSEPKLLKKLLKLLDAYNATAVPPANLPDDPRGDPRLWDHTWSNFGDYNYLLNTVK